MVTDQEQRVPGSPSGEPAALLPSPNVLTTCTDERRMAFVNAALLVRILPSPRCCRLGDDDGLSSRDGKLHLSLDRTRSYHVLLIQDPLHVQRPSSKSPTLRPRYRLALALSPLSSLSLLSSRDALSSSSRDLCRVVARRHNSHHCTLLWFQLLRSHCCLAVLSRCLVLWLSRCLASSSCLVRT